MSLWSKAKDYVSKTGRKSGMVAEKVGYAIGRKASEVYQKRWGEGGREARIEAYEGRTAELRAKNLYAMEKQRSKTIGVRQESVNGRGKKFDMVGSIMGKTNTNYDYITGKKGVDYNYILGKKNKTRGA